MEDSGNGENKEESVGISAQKVTSNIFSIRLTNVERLKTTLSTVAWSDLIETAITAPENNLRQSS
jgi:hypothetical protein